MLHVTLVAEIGKSAPEPFHEFEEDDMSNKLLVPTLVTFQESQFCIPLLLFSSNDIPLDGLKDSFFQIYIVELTSTLFDLSPMVRSLQVNIGCHREYASLLQSCGHLVLLLYLLLTDLFELFHEVVVFTLLIDKLGDHELEVL